MRNELHDEENKKDRYNISRLPRHTVRLCRNVVRASSRDFNCLLIAECKTRNDDNVEVQKLLTQCVYNLSKRVIRTIVSRYHRRYDRKIARVARQRDVRL